MYHSIFESNPSSRQEPKRAKRLYIMDIAHTYVYLKYNNPPFGAIG